MDVVLNPCAICRHGHAQNTTTTIATPTAIAVAPIRATARYTSPTTRIAPATWTGTSKRPSTTMPASKKVAVRYSTTTYDTTNSPSTPNNQLESARCSRSELSASRGSRSAHTNQPSAATITTMTTRTTTNTVRSPSAPTTQPDTVSTNVL